MADYFHLYLKVLGKYYTKKISNNVFSTNINNLKCFGGKKIKVGLHKHNFSPAMHGLGVFSNNKRCSMQKERNICKADIFHQNKHDHQLFLQIFSPVFERSQKIHSLESSFGCTKVALLRAMTVQSAFSGDSFKLR